MADLQNRNYIMMQVLFNLGEGWFLLAYLPSAMTSMALNAFYETTVKGGQNILALQLLPNRTTDRPTHARYQDPLHYNITHYRC